MPDANAPEVRHFLDLDLLPSEVLRKIIDAGKALKRGEFPKGNRKPLADKALAMIFEKPSTRTRVSFELGMKKLGGDAVVLERESSQLGRGETVADTARVLSRYVDCIMVRTTKEQKLKELAENATVPVINGLTDRTHPCQLMADVMTFEEHRGPIAGKRITWSGDGNNMATSWIHAAVQFGFELNVACPGNLVPPSDVVNCRNLPFSEKATSRAPSALSRSRVLLSATGKVPICSIFSPSRRRTSKAESLGIPAKRPSALTLG